MDAQPNTAPTSPILEGQLPATSNMYKIDELTGIKSIEIITKKDDVKENKKIYDQSVESHKFPGIHKVVSTNNAVVGAMKAELHSDKLEIEADSRQKSFLILIFIISMFLSCGDLTRQLELNYYIGWILFSMGYYRIIINLS